MGFADKIGNSSQFGGAGGQGQTLEPNEIKKTATDALLAQLAAQAWQEDNQKLNKTRSL